MNNFLRPNSARNAIKRDSKKMGWDAFKQLTDRDKWDLMRPVSYLELLRNKDNNFNLADLSNLLTLAFQKVLQERRYKVTCTASLDESLYHYCSLTTVINNVSRRQLGKIDIPPEDDTFVRELISTLNVQSRKLRADARQFHKGIDVMDSFEYAHARFFSAHHQIKCLYDRHRIEPIV